LAPTKPHRLFLLERLGAKKRETWLRLAQINGTTLVCSKTKEGTPMSNIAIALKAEIIRLARKELRSETANFKKASAQYRSDIAALKRRLAALEKQLSNRAEKAAALPVSPDTGTGVRYSAKSLSAQRKRLGLSAADMGTLLGVSAQTVYSWEAEKSRPRQTQMAAIRAVRKLGKKEAAARLKAQK
jgi:DNA-binding transcriptional regulator YiaG